MIDFSVQVLGIREQDFRKRCAQQCFTTTYCVSKHSQLLFIKHILTITGMHSCALLHCFSFAAEVEGGVRVRVRGWIPRSCLHIPKTTKTD